MLLIIVMCLNNSFASKIIHDNGLNHVYVYFDIHIELKNSLIWFPKLNSFYMVELELKI